MLARGPLVKGWRVASVKWLKSGAWVKISGTGVRVKVRLVVFLWYFFFISIYLLTHLPLALHIYASMNWVNIGSGNGLSPDRRQAIIWTSAGRLLIDPLGVLFGEILIEIHIFSSKKMRLKMSSAKWRTFCSRRCELNPAPFFFYLYV